MTDLYENLLKATSNIDDITTEKYATVTKLNGNYCDAKEEDTGLEHTNVPIINGANLSVGDKAIIGFLNNSIYDVVCYGALDKTIHDDTKQDLLISGQNIKTINHTSLLGSGNIDIQGGGGGSVDVVTSWESTLSDSKVPSEKLVKNSLDDKISKSSTSGLVKNDGTIDTTSYSTFSGSYNDLSNKPTIPSASTTTPSADTSSGSYGSGTSYARSNHTHPKSSLYAEATHSHTKSQITDFPSIPSKTSDLTNDGADGTNVFVANNDSRLSDARTPTSHTHGNLTNDGKVGSTANYFVYTTTGGAITSKQKIGNITTSGAIGSTTGKPIITTTNGVLTTGSFGTSSGTFAEGNHTHSGYVSATKVTSWQSTPSDSNVPSEKLVKDTIDAIEDLIGDAITYINGTGGS